MTKSNYTAEKRLFCFEADSQLRGMNATCKVIVELYKSGNEPTINTFNADALKIDTFETKEFISIAKEFLPKNFTKDNGICANPIRVYKTEVNKQRIANFMESGIDFSEGNDDKGEFFTFKPVTTKWTTNMLYNFVKRAYLAKDRANNTAAKLAKLTTEELEKELAKRK